MVGLVLVSHSRRLARSVAELIQQTVGSTVRVAYSGGAGENHQEFGTDALEIQKAIQSVYSEDGVLVFTDMGSAVLSAETAKDFLEPAQQLKVSLTSTPLVEGGIAAAVQAEIGAPLEEVIKAAQRSLIPKQEQLSSQPTDSVATVQAAPGAENQSAIELEIRNQHGLHLRPAATLIKALARFEGKVWVENRSKNRGRAPATSLVDVTRLQIHQGDLVRFTVSAADPVPLIQTIQSLVENQFGESNRPAAPPDAEAPVNRGGPFGVSPGIAIGKTRMLRAAVPPIPTYQVKSSSEAESEVVKLHSALAAAGAELQGRVDRLKSSLETAETEILEAQRMIFDDPTLIREAEGKIRNEQANAANAWHEVLSQHAEEIGRADDPYLRARAADFKEADEMVRSHLTGRANEAALVEQPFTEATILICDELTAGLADQLHRLHVVGVIQLDGGTTSHGAILARALGLPAVGGGRKMLTQIRATRRAAIDGTTGSIWLDPDETRSAQLIERQRAERSELGIARAQASEPVITRDGVRIDFGANAGSAAEVAEAREQGAEFIGLFRSEFLFQAFRKEPSEEEQFAAYQAALVSAGDSLPVTVRLLDLGGDKSLPFLRVASEANPFLGLRGIRLLLANPDFLRAHLKAILRLASWLPVQILLPMVSELNEVLITRKMLREVAAELQTRNVAHRWPIPVGVMIETPSAALLADQLAAHLDFLSLGTNDLTQYVLCAERGNPSLTQFADALHPAVLRLCKQVMEVAAKKGLKVSICGEIASDIAALPVLIGIGLQHLSVSPRIIPKSRACVRNLDTTDLRSKTAALLEKAATAEEVRRAAAL